MHIGASRYVYRMEHVCLLLAEVLDFLCSFVVYINIGIYKNIE